MADVDLRKATDQAEAGDGCALKAGLGSVSFDDSLKIFKQIAAQNETDRKTNSNVPPVYVDSGVKNDLTDSAYAQLYVAEPGTTVSWGTEIMDTSIDLGRYSKNNGTVTTTCETSEKSARK